MVSVLECEELKESWKLWDGVAALQYENSTHQSIVKGISATRLRSFCRQKCLDIYL